MATAVAGTSRAGAGRRGGQPAGDGRSRHGTLLETWSAQHRASVQPRRTSGARRGTGGCRMPPMTASTVVPDRPARRAGVIRRALRREATRIREPKRIARDADHRRRVRARDRRHVRRAASTAGADAQAYWAGGPDLARGRRPVPPDGPVPALRLRPVDAAAVHPVGAAAVGRRVVRVARRDDPAAAVVDPLGLHAAAAADRDPRPHPGVPDRRRTSTPGTSTCCSRSRCSGAQFTGPRLGGLHLGPRDVDEVGARRCCGRCSQPRARGWGLVFLARLGAARRWRCCR